MPINSAHEGSVEFEAVHTHKDGREIPVEITSRVVKYEDKEVYLSFVRDITERRHAEADLQLDAPIYLA